MDEETCILLLPRELPGGGAPQDGGMMEMMDGGRMEDGTVQEVPADGEN